MSPKVHLHADDFWRFVKYGAIAPYLPEAHEQNEVVIDVIVRAAERFAVGGYFVILDGIIGPWFLEPFRALTVPLHYVVMRSSLDVAIQRCRERGGNTLTDVEAIASLHRQFSQLGEFERHSLQTEKQSRKETRRLVVEAVASGAFRLF